MNRLPLPHVEDSVSKVRPINYTVDQPTVITQEQGYAGFVVLMPRGLTAEGGVEYHVELFVGKGTPWVILTPSVARMLVIDVAPGADLTPAALLGVVMTLLPVKAPVVLAYP